MKTPHSMCLLMVEDDPKDVSRLKQAVRQSGFAVELSAVDDGLEALQFLRQHGEHFQHAPRPDLILLDIKLPGQDGLEFLATVKQDERLRAIPVVVMSTTDTEADVRAAYHLGAAGYVLKPTDANEFASAVNKLCQYWVGRMRLPENIETCTGWVAASTGNNA